MFVISGDLYEEKERVRRKNNNKNCSVLLVESLIRVMY